MYVNCGECGRRYYCQIDPAECDNLSRTVFTNADKIRSMSDEELAEFIRSMVDESNSHNVACYGCINYGTHHSDPVNKGTPLYECDGCENEGIGLDLLMWLQLEINSMKDCKILESMKAGET